jgi:cytochrome P450
MASTDEERAPGCPVIDIDYRTNPRPAFSTYESLNEVRELSAFAWNKTPNGYWMVNRYDDVKEALQRTDVFSNRIVSALGEKDPSGHPKLIPNNLNGQEHVQYRHVVNPWFSPISIQRAMPYARVRCIELVEKLRARGSCDLTVEFAMEFPTEIFFHLLGLPPSDGRDMVPLVEGMFRGFFGGDPVEFAQVVDEIKAYFQRVVDDRVAHPRSEKDDFVSYLLGAQVGGEAIPPEDVLVVCLTIMTAALDTTRSALGYIFHHLATHPADRQRLIGEPELIPEAVEEFLRLYPLVFQDGRYVEEDVEFHGCPMQKGDIVWLGLAQANRDPRKFERPDEFVLGRESNKHLGFAAGAHRCLGSHLARAELIIVLEEWLPRIPEFRIDETQPLTERGGQLMLHRVPLEWSTNRAGLDEATPG